MKIAIITITDGANYGNRLQNYALQTVLESLAGSCDTLKRSTSRDVGVIKKTLVLTKDICKKILGKKTSKIYRIRKKRFENFNNEYINWSSVVLKNNIAPDGLNEKYDYFICGSDQVWNTKFDVIKEDFLNYLSFFAEPNKRISYAASFGTNEIDDTYRMTFKKELSKFKAISVREKVGVDLVRNLTNQKAQLVIDPTMLLKVDDWKNIFKKPSYMKENLNFVVTYFMGGRNVVISQYISKVKSEMNCDMVINLDVEFIDRNSIESQDAFCTSPDEFLWLIYHSKAVLTDSFHATVFSLLFHKPFCVFERKAQEKGNNMGSRIETLLEYFNLECMKDNINNPTKIPQVYDGNKIDEILNIKRAESLSFLKSALDLNDNRKE